MQIPAKSIAIIALLAVGGISAPFTYADARPASSAKYTPATPEEAQAVDEWAKDEAEKVEQQLNTHLFRLETPHFQIYTDWDPREYSFLKNNFEAAYAAVSRQFNIPPSENIFLGKLPCFVFTSFGTFARFSKGFKMPDLSPGIQGYYMGGNDGFGFMATHKPQDEFSGSALNDKITLWKYVLTHEMTHAFVARYISDKRVITWLNEGIAEVVASNAFPRDIRLDVKEAERRYNSLHDLFADDNKFRSADLYPVMRTLVEVLVRRSKAVTSSSKLFIQMFDDIKAGKSPTDALMENYHWTLAQLEAVWRQYVRSM